MNQAENAEVVDGPDGAIAADGAAKGAAEWSRAPDSIAAANLCARRDKERARQQGISAIARATGKAVQNGVVAGVIAKRRVRFLGVGKFPVATNPVPFKCPVVRLMENPKTC